MKAWIPNFVTLLNLFCGCAAIICVLDYRFIAAFWFLFAAGWFDFADGMVARALNVSSEHGKELDSLADMVSFGAAPAMIYYVLIYIAMQETGAVAGAEAVIGEGGSRLPVTWSWYAAPALVLAMFSALRLAKFNLDTRQSENFIGVATPTSTVFATGLMLIYALDSFGWGQYVLNPWLLYVAVGLMSYLLVSEHPMFSFKLKGLQWKGNGTRIIFAALGIALLILLGAAAFPFVVIVYVLLNLVSPPTVG